MSRRDLEAAPAVPQEKKQGVEEVEGGADGGGGGEIDAGVFEDVQNVFGVAGFEEVEVGFALGGVAGKQSPGELDGGGHAGGVLVDVEVVVEVGNAGPFQCDVAVGGETAEMPGFYPEGEYDLAGFAVGIVDKKKVINGKDIVPGDVLIGLKSTGVHSNGYSLVRKLFGDSDKAALETYDEELGATPAEVLLKPTRIYVKSILALLEKVEVKGIAHITGGGFIENIPRILPEGVAAEIDTKSYDVPPVFKVMQKRAGITDEQIYNTFNMGIGMVVCVSPENVDAAMESLKATGEEVVVLGKTVVGKGVILK